MSECGVLESHGGPLARLERALVEQRVPAEGTFAITRRCNLACVHCYLGDRPPGTAPGPEIAVADAARILDQLLEAGTLHLALTGGEPLLHPGFGEIYRRAASGGMLVTVLTNATVVGRAIVRLMRQLPPRRLEVTVHGSTARTFDAVTRVPGSHERFRRGLDALLDAGVRVALKTVVMRQNVGELGEIEDFARERGLPFRYDTAVFPALDLPGRVRRPVRGELERLRLPPREAAALDAHTAERSLPWVGALERHPGSRPDPRLYRCGAALTNFHVDEEGRLAPCLLVGDVMHDLLRGTFREGWDGPLARFRERPAPPGHPCPTCPAAPVCSACPAMSALEGNPDAPPGHACSTALLRHALLSRIMERAMEGQSA